MSNEQWAARERAAFFVGESRWLKAKDAGK
jgi:hypothetical protein